MIINRIHVLKQGDPWQTTQNTNSSPPIPINLAPVSSQISSDPETSPKPKKCTSPNGSHGLNQGYPWPNLQSKPTYPIFRTKQAPASSQTHTDPDTFPKSSKYSIPKGSHSPKQGDPWKSSQDTHPSTPIMANQPPASSQDPSEPETIPKPKKCMIPNEIHDLNQGDPWPKVQSNPTPTPTHTKQAPPHPRPLHTPKHHPNPQNLRALTGSKAQNRGVPVKILRTPTLRHQS